MTAVSDVFAAAEGGGRGAGKPLTNPLSARGGQAGTRARVAVTERDSKVRALIDGVRSDVAGAWPWSEAPPSLRDLRDDRKAQADAVPDASRGLQIAWTVYNTAVVIPVSAVVYVLLWIVQHPARLLLTAAILVPLIAAIATSATG